MPLPRDACRSPHAHGLTPRPVTPRRAFSLVELLCVMTIIAVLAGLLLGAVSRAYERARRFQFEMEAPVLVDQFIENLRRFTQAQPAFPALTARQWREIGVFDEKLTKFLAGKRVAFHPFASTHAPEAVILEIRFSKTYTQRVLKKELLPPPQE